MITPCLLPAEATEAEAYAERYPVVSLPSPSPASRTTFPPVLLAVADEVMRAVDLQTWSLVLSRSNPAAPTAVIGRFVALEQPAESSFSNVLERGNLTTALLTFIQFGQLPMPPQSLFSNARMCIRATLLLCAVQAFKCRGGARLSRVLICHRRRCQCLQVQLPQSAFTCSDTERRASVTFQSSSLSCFTA